jgi:hypothetical protein
LANGVVWNCLQTTSVSYGYLQVFAHGFVLTSESAEFLYMTTDYGYPEHERSLLWSDPTVGIQWPVDGAPKLAAKDAAGKVLAEADAFACVSASIGLKAA